MDIYITCPRNVITGGVELLHQLCYELNTYENINAYIWYLGQGTNTDHAEPYKKYNCPVCEDGIDISSILIFPEIYVNMALHDSFKSMKKIIYWESVDNYFNWIDYSNKMKMPENCIHLAQSHYALNFLETTLNIKEENTLYVTDYLNDKFLEDYDNSIERKRQVVYNPIKGYEYTKEVIESLYDIDFIPIRNMNVDQVRDLLRSSMLYLDLGDFPGKDRIPREACISGCCIITGLNGASNYKEDVYIKDKYKINRENTKLICNRVRELLDNYDECNKDFDEYRLRIRKEPEQFKEGIKKLVQKLESST